MNAESEALKLQKHFRPWGVQWHVATKSKLLLLLLLSVVVVAFVVAVVVEKRRCPGSRERSFIFFQTSVLLFDEFLR